MKLSQWRTPSLTWMILIPVVALLLVPSFPTASEGRLPPPVDRYKDGGGDEFPQSVPPSQSPVEDGGRLSRSSHTPTVLHCEDIEQRLSHLLASEQQMPWAIPCHFLLYWILMR